MASWSNGGNLGTYSVSSTIIFGDDAEPFFAHEYAVDEDGSYYLTPYADMYANKACYKTPTPAKGFRSDSGGSVWFALDEATDTRTLNGTVRRPRKRKKKKPSRRPRAHDDRLYSRKAQRSAPSWAKRR